LVNTVGILEILYIFVFSEMKVLQGKSKAIRPVEPLKKKPKKKKK
jgi:hypothetical protein